MHLGLMLIMDWLAGPSKETEEKKEHQSRLNKLSPEELRLYKQFVEALFEACSKTRKRDQSEDPPRFAVVFRQAESWKEFEKKLVGIPDTYYWKTIWQGRISDLRDDQKNMYDAARRILQGEEHALVAQDKQTIADLMDSIKRTLDRAKKELDQDQNDETLLKNDRIKLAIRFLVDKWLLLTVCAEWAEVPVDCEEKLFVRVRQLPKDLLYKPADLVNDSTRVIFVASESDFEDKEETTGDPLQVKEIRETKKLDFTDQACGPDSPRPIEKPPIITAEEFYGIDGVGDDLLPKLPKPKHSGTYNDLRLPFLSAVALDAVNFKLKV